MSDRWARRAPWTGIAAVVLFIIAFVVGGETPDFDASTKDIVDYYNDQTAQVITSVLLLYGSVLLVFFAATLRSALREANALSNLVLIGGALEASGTAIFGGLNFALTDLANSDHLSRVDPGALQTLNALNSDFFFPLVLGTSIFLISAGLAIFASGGLPRWMGWVALLLGIVALTPGGFFAFIASGLWILAASVILLRRGESAAAGGAAAPAAPEPAS
jgi:hypothetical protein